MYGIDVGYRHNGTTCYHWRLYLWFFWIKNFKTQKRIENQAVVARTALGEVLEVKIALIRVMYGTDESERLTALSEYLPIHLIKLQYTLLLLRHSPKIREKLQTLEQILILILNSRNEHHLPEMSNRICQMLQGSGEATAFGDIKMTGFLNDLTMLLLNIHELTDIAKDN